MSDVDYFDDCPICQAMKEAENQGGDLGAYELTKAFKKAKEKGAVIGGPLLDKEDGKSTH